MSRNASELDSASLRYVGVAKLPKMLKPGTDGEETFTRSRRAPRGGWRWRVSKDLSRNLRDPVGTQTCHRESEDPIVAGKGLMNLEPRGSTTNMQGSKLHAAA